MTGRARFLSVAGAVGWRTIHHFMTNPAFLLPSLIFPLFFFTAFAGGLSGLSDIPAFNFPSGYTAFQFVFVLLQASAFGGVFTGFSIAADFESGFSRRLFLAAPNRLAIVAGYALAALTRALLVGTLLFAVALATGMQVGGGPVDIGGLVLLALGVNVAAVLFACGVAMRLRTMQAGPAMQMPVFFALFLAPVYVPIELIDSWVRSAAEVNPVTPLLELGRGLISGGAPGATGFLVALTLVVVAAAWAVRGLRNAEAAGG